MQLDPLRHPSSFGVTGSSSSIPGIPFWSGFMTPKVLGEEEGTALLSSLGVSSSPSLLPLLAPPSR